MTPGGRESRSRPVPCLDRVWAALVLVGSLLLVVGTPQVARGQANGEGAADTTDTRRVQIIGADQMRGTVEDSTSVRYMTGNVRLRQGQTYLRADRATQYPSKGEVIFVGDVLIIDEGDTLSADHVRYDSQEKVGRATGDMRLADDEVTLTGPTGRYFFRDKHAVFRAGVTLIDSARVLKSRAGDYFSEEERAEFYGDVHLFSDSTYLAADSVTYFRSTEVSEARGDVFIERRGDDEKSAEAGHRAVEDTSDSWPELASRLAADTAQASGRKLWAAHVLPADTIAYTLLFGDYAYNDPAEEYSRVTGDKEVQSSALLMRFQPPDSAGARPDTLLMQARALETNRSKALNRLTATDSVRIWQRDLAAVADSAVYDQLPERRRGESSTQADSSRSVRTRRPEHSEEVLAGVRAASQSEIRETRLYDAPVAWSRDAQLSGDTIRVVGRGSSVDSLMAGRRAFVAQMDTTLDRINQLKGRHLTGLFAPDSTGSDQLRYLHVGPNAQLLRFLTSDAGQLDGAVQASGDYAEFWFESGELQRAALRSGVQGQRYPAEKVPSELRLEGLRWQPGRRPRKEGFLRGERVRRRLQDSKRPLAKNASPEDRSASSTAGSGTNQTATSTSGRRQR